MYVKSVIFLVEKNICKLFCIVCYIVVYFPQVSRGDGEVPIKFPPGSVVVISG